MIPANTVKLYFVLSFLIVHTSAQCGTCESKSTASACSSVTDCPNGWTPYKNEKCFKVFTEKKTYDAAKQACEVEGGTLACPISQLESAFIADYVTKQVPLAQLADMWVGGKKIGHKFAWADYNPFVVTNWVPTYPIPIGDCVFVCTSGPRQVNPQDHTYGLFANFECTNTNQYVCQQFQIDTRKIQVVPRSC